MRLNLGDSVNRCYSYRLVEIAWMVLFLLLLLSLYCRIHSFIHSFLMVVEVKKKTLGHIQREWKIKDLNIENWERVQNK